MFNSLAIPLPDASNTALTFDSERWDTDDIHSITVDTSRLTAQIPGKYLIFGHAWITGGSSGSRVLRILLNGTMEIGVAQVFPTNTETLDISVATHYELAPGDYVELVAWVSGSGGALSVLNAPSKSPEFGMVKLP